MYWQPSNFENLLVISSRPGPQGLYFNELWERREVRFARANLERLCPKPVGFGTRVWFVAR